MFVGLYFIKESPQWLFSKRKHKIGLQNLYWIRKLAADDLYNIGEVGAIETALGRQPTTDELGVWQLFKAFWGNNSPVHDRRFWPHHIPCDRALAPLSHR